MEPSRNCGITKSRSPPVCAASAASQAMMNLLSHVAVPTDKKPAAQAPQGWPLEHVLVRQLMPRTSETEHTTEATVTLWKSEYLRPDQIIRSPPNSWGMLACKTRLSHCTTTNKGSGRDSWRSAGTFDFCHPWINGESKNDQDWTSACLRHHCKAFKIVDF